jgi:hypothetical protein
MCKKVKEYKIMLSTALKAKIKRLVTILLLAGTMLLMTPAVALAAPHECGSGDTKYTPSIELGCTGKGNAIMDLMFAAIRFLSMGVGLVIVGSMIYAGIQYIGSRGDPNALGQAVKRIQANVFALLLFIFAYAILNYLVPGALLQ